MMTEENLAYTAHKETCGCEAKCSFSIAASKADILAGNEGCSEHERDSPSHHERESDKVACALSRGGRPFRFIDPWRNHAKDDRLAVIRGRKNMDGGRIAIISTFPSTLQVKGFRREPFWSRRRKTFEIKPCSLEQVLPVRLLCRGWSFSLARNCNKRTQTANRVESHSHHAGLVVRRIIPLNSRSGIIRDHQIRALTEDKTYCSRIGTADGLTVRRRHLHSIAIEKVVIIPGKPPGPISHLTVSGARGDLTRPVFKHFRALLHRIEGKIGGIPRHPQNSHKRHQRKREQRPGDPRCQRLLSASSG